MTIAASIPPVGDRGGPLRRRVRSWYRGPDPGPERRSTAAVLVLVLLITGTVIQLARIPRPDWNILWAEDGAVFLRDALLGDGPLLLLHPYSGYLHIAPRLLAAVGALVPLDIAPAALTIAATASVSAVAAAAALLLRARIRSWGARLAAWLAIFALPIMGGEVLGSIANLHWFLLVGAACAAFTPVTTRSTAVTQAILLALAVLSDPLGLLLLPVLLVRWWAFRGRRESAILATFVAAGAVQVCGTVVGSVLQGERIVSASRPSALGFADFYARRVVETGVLGVGGTLAVEAAAPRLAAVAVGVAALALLVVGVFVSRSRRAGIVVFFTASVVFAAIVWSLQWEFLAAGGALALGQGDRYSVVPVALFLLALIQAADAVVARVSAPGPRVLLGLAVMLAVLVPCVADARVFTKRAGTPPWSDQLAVASRVCEDPDVDRADVAIAPAPFIVMQLPCRPLRADQG